MADLVIIYIENKIKALYMYIVLLLGSLQVFIHCCLDLEC